jgi:hypothetical protein
MSRRRICVGLVLFLFFTGCASAFEVGNAIRSLQQKFDTLFVSLQENPSAPFEQHAAFYAEARAELATLRTQAAIAGADDIGLALKLIEENLGRLEESHRDGLNAAEVPLLRELFGTQLGALHRPRRLSLRGLARTEV